MTCLLGVLALVAVVAGAAVAAEDDAAPLPNGPMPKGTIVLEGGLILGSADIQTEAGVRDVHHFSFDSEAGFVMSDSGLGVGVGTGIGQIGDSDATNTRLDLSAFGLWAGQFPTRVVAKVGYGWTDLDSWGYYGPLLGLSVRQPVAANFGLYGRVTYLPSLRGAGELRGSTKNGNKWEVGISYKGFSLGYRSETFNATMGGNPMGDTFSGIILGFASARSLGDGLLGSD
jgi:hypothetical protein